MIMKKTDVCVGIVGLVFLFSVAAAHIILPDREMSELENRYFQTQPTFSISRLFSGAWGDDVETYLIDQFPLRESWVGLNSSYERYLLVKKEIGGIYISDGDRLFPKTADPDGGFNRNLSALKKIKDFAGDRFKVILPPTATAILADELPDHAPYHDERDTVAKIANELGNGVVIDVYDRLKASSATGDTYFRTDHHWTMRGAYEAYAAYVSALGITPLPLSDFSATTITSDFRGTSYAKAGLWHLPPENIDLLSPPGGYAATTDGMSIFDSEKLTGYDKYAYFLGGNKAMQTIESNVGTGRTLIMIKDSYAHILTPFLTLHFDKIVLLDPRYIAANPYELIAAESRADILVLMNADGIGKDNGLSLFLRYSPAE